MLTLFSSEGLLLFRLCLLCSVFCSRFCRSLLVVGKYYVELRFQPRNCAGQERTPSRLLLAHCAIYSREVAVAQPSRVGGPGISCVNQGSWSSTRSRQDEGIARQTAAGLTGSVNERSRGTKGDPISDALTAVEASVVLRQQNFRSNSRCCAARGTLA